MGSENIGSKRSSNSISILVVDDDTTCLSFVAALLKKFKYEVVTAKHPSDALCALRIKGGAFDLVVSDVNMPDMNGFELQEAISHEFNLPVVLMSVDSNPKGLKSGAALFISKPVRANDLKDLWQFATSNCNMRKKRQVVIEDEERNNSNSTRNGKKAKVKWTNGLQNRFLEAIRSIGLERSVPKKILEVMNVPGLTRENVASHLQKYRMFLKRVSDASCKVGDGDEGGLITRGRNYSLQTLSNKHQFLNFPPPSSSSFSYQNSLIDDDDDKPVINHEIQSPFTIRLHHRSSFHTSQDNASIDHIGSSGMSFPSTNAVVENKTNNRCSLLEECLNVGTGNGGMVGSVDESSSPLPLLPSSHVYDDQLLLPSFDAGATTHLLQNNIHQLTILNQPQPLHTHTQSLVGVDDYTEFDEYTAETPLLFPGGVNDSSFHQEAVNKVQGSMGPAASSSGFNNKPLESTNGDGIRDEDALESLLAFGLFGEDQIQSLEGI